MIYSGKSDVGKKRPNNQDSFHTAALPDGSCFFTVCDGMGGANGGSVASSLACSVYTEQVLLGYTPDASCRVLMTEAAAAANAAVFEAAQKDEALRGMGTTLVSAIVRPDGETTVVNVGDSRLYVTQNGNLRQITHDHSYVQYLVDKGQMTLRQARESSARNIITRSIGNEPQVSPDVFELILTEGQYILLCSDGLTNNVEPELLSQTVLGAGEDPDAVVGSLIALANEGGGTDNITVILGRF